MGIDISVFYSFLIINIILYTISIYFIIIKRNSEVISVRSPILLIINNVGGFILSTTFILYEIMEYYIYDPLNNAKFQLVCHTLSYNYLVFHFMMFFSFILRCNRIINCCNMEIEE